MDTPKVYISDAALLAMAERLEAPEYWLSGSDAGHEGENSAPVEAAATLRAIVDARQAPQDVVEALARLLWEAKGAKSIFGSMTHPNNIPIANTFRDKARAFLAAHWPLAATPVDGRMQADPVVKPDVAGLVEALKPLAAIADAFDANELDDEARKFWGLNGVNTTPHDQIELYSGRGGKQLLTLADAMRAREALKNV